MKFVKGLGTAGRNADFEFELNIQELIVVWAQTFEMF